MSEIRKETTHYIDSGGRHVGSKTTIDVRSYERPKRFYRRFEFWLIVVAVAIATVLLGLGGCAPVEHPKKPVGPPDPANAREYRLTTRFGRVESVRIVEFSDSAGRLCVAAIVGGTSSQRPVGLDCTSLPPIAIERLPE